ncbi:MAG: hypothetical protein OEZ68_22120 [Gammaproteobacteria bacterium]|nr:hypothetical protein [Gammaproteobacteria bacterium]MDH5803484.1 hypothetical protein [Gammaproteobacteria bacterium]
MKDIPAFCANNCISRAFFYKLQKEGKGPRITKVGRRTLVSDEAETEWRKRMETASNA